MVRTFASPNYVAPEVQGIIQSVQALHDRYPNLREPSFDMPPSSEQGIISLTNPPPATHPELIKALSIEMMRKVKFAQALGSDLGAAVRIEPHTPQPEWGPLISKAGLLFRKTVNRVWEPAIFFCYNGFLACCDISDERASVEMMTLNLEVALKVGQGDAVPLPLKGCKIFAGDMVKEFAIQFPIPQVVPPSEGPSPGPQVHQLDLAAQDDEVREQWIEEIYKAASVEEGYGGRGEYIPKRLRHDGADLMAASRVVQSQFKSMKPNSRMCGPEGQDTCMLQ